VLSRFANGGEPAMNRLKAANLPESNCHAPRRVTCANLYEYWYLELYEYELYQEEHAARSPEVRAFPLYLPPPGQWTGQKRHEDTGGVVPRSYITNLRAGALTEEEVEQTRTRRIADPTVARWFLSRPSSASSLQPWLTEESHRR
jgi:hypothetical protein